MNKLAKIVLIESEQKGLYRPGVSIQLLNGGKISERMLAIIDTGSDITLIPSKNLVKFGRAELAKVEIRLSNGKVAKSRSYAMSIIIEGFSKPFALKDGVLAARSSAPHPLLGMDILGHCNLVLFKGKGVLMDARKII